MTALPRTTTRDVALADQRNARLHAENIELQRQVDDLRNVLINTADDQVRERGPSFWSKAFHESRLRNARLLADLEKHQRWHLEHGEEAGRLQTMVAERDREIGELTRALDLARAGERCDTTEEG